MFTKTPDVELAVDQAATQFFGGITGDPLGDDESFTAALRVLMKRRIPEGASIWLSISTVNYGEIDTEDADWKKNIVADIGRVVGEGGIIITNLEHFPTQQADEVLSLLGEDFAKEHGFEYMKDISEYVSQSFSLRFHVSDEKKCAIMVVSHLTPQKYHFMQSLIVRAFRVYFKECPPDDEEKDFIRSMTEKLSDHYNEAFKKLLSRYDLSRERTKIIMDKFAASLRSDMIAAEKRMLNDVDQTINNLMSELSAKYLERENRLIRISGLEVTSNDENVKELVDYISRNRFVTVVNSPRKSGLRFEVRCLLDFFDEDVLDKIRKRGDLYRFTGAGPFRDPANVKAIIDAIFSSNPVFKVKLHCCFEIDSAMKDVTVYNDARFSRDPDRMFNPHYQYFGCLGSNRPNIIQAIGEANYVLAIETCIASARGIDLNEWGQTASKFINDIIHDNGKILCLADNEDVSMTPGKALEWLKAKKEDAEK